ncbi:MAG: HAD-IIIA family hydrolase [Saprospiraceae bacterium]|nr:HAD-IIIA family hydrolase [Saprospiraceae bacterium]
MKECIILAGGFGTRLAHLIPELPKCLAPVGERPFLHALLLYLKSQNINHFVFSLGYKSELVIDYVRKNFSDLKFSFVIEDQPLGTGGAIQKAIIQCQSENIFVINADTYYPVDLNSLYQFHTYKKANISLTLKPMVFPHRYGTVEIDIHQKVTQFHEKKEINYGLINGGIYVISKSWFLSLDLPEVFSFEKEVLENENYQDTLFAQVNDLPFIDIGVPEDYARAEEFLSMNLDYKPKIKNLFLDRDGVINELRPNDYVKKFEEFMFRAEVLEELHLIAPSFEKIFVVTNQAGIGKALMTDEDLLNIHDMMEEFLEFFGVRFAGIYFCPHTKESECNCRKPKSGMLDQAKMDFPNLLFAESVIIGDSNTDMLMGRSRGMKTVALGSNFRDEQGKPIQDHVVESLKEFRENILPQFQS